jgi:osmoprotectant transport system permease protein
MVSRQSLRWILLIVLIGAFVTLLSNQSLWQTFLHFLFPQQAQVLYPSVSLLVLVGQHMKLVLISSVLTIFIGIPVGIWVTRPGGSEFLSIVNDLTSFGQTFPPVAVLALAVPLFGFGLIPTVIALFLYGLLPVIRNTIAGLRSVSPNILQVAYGMGMNRLQALVYVEVPLAAPVILAGVRISAVINVGTAMIGAVIGAGGLGTPIVAGLVQFNTAYIIEGAIPAAILAILIDQFFANIEHGFAYSSQK